MRTFLSCLLLFMISPLNASEPNGTKMTVRYITDGSSSENTTYWRGDRRRIEYRNSEDHRLGPRLAAITRCDLGKLFELNLDSSQYASRSYPKPLTEERLRDRGLDGRTVSFSEKPTIRIDIKTVDTGERKQMFGHMARHVITTEKRTPLEGSHAQPQESTRDGWYIDLDQQISCDPEYMRKGTTHRYAFVLVAPTGNSRNRIIDKPEFVSIGKPETGFALEEVIVSDDAYTSADGTTKHAKSRTERRVTELYEGPLDASVFEVPHGFRRVKEIERNPPPSSSNGIAELWERLKYTLSRWFSFNED